MWFELHAESISENTSAFLNLARFFAAELVVVGHATNLIAGTLDPVARTLLPFPSLIFLSEIGVFLFFVLSGFLISQTVFSKMKRGGYDFKIYFIDRFARIYSGLVPCLIAILLVNTARIYFNPGHPGDSGTLDAVTLAGNLLMIQEIPAKQMLGTLGAANLPVHFKIQAFGDAIPLWTLSIEWWLYLLFGWLALGRTNQGDKRGWGFYAMLLAFSIIPAAYLFYNNSALVATWFFGAAITIAFSRTLSRARHSAGRIASAAGSFSPRVKKTALAAAFLALVFMLAMRLKSDLAFGVERYSDFILAILVTASFALAVALAKKGAITLSGKKTPGRMKFLAGYSYTLYLLHASVLNLFVSMHLQYPVIVLVASGFIAANMLSAVIAHYTETRHKEFAGWIKTRLALQPAGTRAIKE